MLQAAQIIGVSGYTAALNLADNVFPVKSFSTDVATRNDETTKTQEHGQWQTFDYLDKRTFSFEGDVLGTTTGVYGQYRRNLIRALIPAPELGYRFSCVLQLTLDGYPEDIISECNLDGLPSIPLTADTPAVSQYQINLKAADPFLYGVNLNSMGFSPPLSNPGDWTFPWTFPWTFGDAGSAGAQIIDPGGDAPTWPLWQITGPIVSPQVINVVNGTQYILSLPGLLLSAGISVFLDFKNQTVKAEDGSSLKNYLDPQSTWWRLYPANVNNVIFNCTGAGVGASATLSYNSSYLV